MKLEQLAEVSADVAATSGRLEKIARLAALLREVPADEIPIAIGFLTAWPRQGKIGVGWSSVAGARDTEPATTSTLELSEIDAIFDKLQSTKGRNSGAERARLLGDLFSRATSREQQFLSGLLVGEVRQGALGKAFKGMTDEMLKWQTEELLKREVRREGHIVYVRPELVVEIVFNEVQASSHYPGGGALRFARVKGYRPDKKPTEADTIDTVRSYLTE